MEQEGEPIQVEASDEFGFSERLVAEKIPADEPTRVTSTRVSDSSVPFSSASDVKADGTISFNLTGKPQHGEEGVTAAVNHVVDQLNRRGASWSDIREIPHDSRIERDVDAVARNEWGDELRFQVTRAEQAVWAPLDRIQEASGTQTADDLVEALRAAIRKKENAADLNVILVLDAVGTPQFVDTKVLELFRERYGRAISGVGFREVWLAAPTAERTTRLDDPGSP